LFDEKREHEKILDSVQPTTRSTTRTSTYLLNDEDDDDDDDVIKNDLIDANKPNNYHLITKSTYADCYMIDKESYFKYMLAFSSILFFLIFSHWLHFLAKFPNCYETNLSREQVVINCHQVKR